MTGTTRQRLIARSDRGEKPPTVSVVIATYTERRWDSLCRAVAAASAQRPSPHEVIVVVDHHPALLQRARDAFAGAIVIANTRARGDAGSANSGAACATGDVIALLDDDAVPDSGWLAALLDAYTGEDVLGVGGTLTPRWTDGRPGWFPDEFLWVVGCSYRGLPRGRAPVRNLIGANMSVRRDLFLEIGGFREDLARVGTKPFAGREAEFCIRAARARPAGRFVHEPAARVAHLVTPERAQLSYFLRHCHDEGFAKAMLTRLVGPADGLSEERRYVRKTLPDGVARGILESFAGGDPAGALRSASIVAGAVTAALGYGHGLAATRRRVKPVAARFSPVRIAEIELTRPLPRVEPAASAGGRTHGRLLGLVRLHGTPLGQVRVGLTGGALGEAELARAIWEQLGREVVDHLAADGFPRPIGLTPAGVMDPFEPPCRRELEAFTARAPRASEIVPTCDRPDALRRCLESLLASDYPAERFEVIVVDNRPTAPATAEMLAALPDRGRVRYVREETPGGASARNAGARVASGDLLAFTDDDVRVDRDWLLSLARAFSVVRDVGCVTGLILPLEIETPAQALLEEYGGFAKGFDRRVFDLEAFRPAAPTFPFSAGMLGSGSSMAFARDAFDELGGFDPVLGNGTPTLGGEDIELLFRAVVEGYRLVYEPRAIVYHAADRSYAHLRRQVYAYGVALSAFLTRSLVERPGLLPDFLRCVPSGIRYALSPSSEKNARKTAAYPEELRRRELVGMLVGPLAYARSRAAARRRLRAREAERV